MAELMTRGFVTSDELTQPSRSYTQGYNQATAFVQNARASKQQHDFDKIAELEFKDVQDGVANAVNQQSQQTAAPGAAQSLPAPTPAQSPATQAGSAAAPAAQPSSVPTGAVTRTATPTAGAAPQEATPAPTPTAVVPPQEVAAPQGQQSPAAVVEQQVRSAPVLGNTINTMSDKVFAQRSQSIEKMVQSGQISATSGKAYLATISAARDARIKSAIDLADKLSLIESRGEEVTDKKVARAATIRKEQDNQYGQVFEVYKESGSEVAQQYARELGFNIDFNKTKDLVTLESRAKRSDYYNTRLDQQKKQNDINQGSINTGDIPPGWRNVGGAWIKPDGVRASGAETEAAIATDQASKNNRGKTTVNVNTSDITKEPIPKGAIRLKGIGADDQIKAADDLDASENVLSSAQRMKELYPAAVKASGIDPKDSAFKAKFKVWWETKAGNDPNVRELKSIIQDSVNQDLRLNKGAQTEGDAQRSATAMATIDMPPTAFNNLVDRMAARNTKIRDKSRDIIRGYVYPNKKDRPKDEASADTSSASPDKSITSKYGKYAVGNK